MTVRQIRRGASEVGLHKADFLEDEVRRVKIEAKARQLVNFRCEDEARQQNTKVRMNIIDLPAKQFN